MEVIKMKGICPVCNGTKRMLVAEEHQKYKGVLSGYNPYTDTLPCDNCGGQYMFSLPSGAVSLRPDGKPCKHEYKSKSDSRFRSLRIYNCIHCDDFYEIDSGD
jgi:hypothetical protein